MKRNHDNRIDVRFAALKSKGEVGLIPFITAGDPDLDTTLGLLRALALAGADCIELGVPFSDPMADGLTIQRASERALKAGASLPRILELVREFRRESDIPIVLFGYYNPFFRYGVERFSRDAAAAGVDGVLCVDLPPEEADELRRCSRAAGLHNILLLAPTSDAERIRLVASRAGGFIYYVSVTGVTGARRRVERELRDRVGQLRHHTSLPVGVGFGVSTPRQAAWIASFADAVVVGSALIEAVDQAKGKREKIRRARSFLARMKRAIRGVAKKSPARD
jgi:tryptophan synthase alpha chain